MVHNLSVTLRARHVGNQCGLRASNRGLSLMLWEYEYVYSLDPRRHFENHGSAKWRVGLSAMVQRSDVRLVRICKLRSPFGERSADC